MTLLRTSLVLSLLAAPAFAQDADLIEKGRYVAIAADCAACHTNPEGGAPYAGGYVIHSPMGGIVATNITPSQEFGIGTWTEEEFIRAVREGVSPDWHLYPAMPYTAYAQITDEDMHALWAYVRSVPAVDAAPELSTKLDFPFNQRWLMMGWNLMFARGEPADPAVVAQSGVARGEYLTNALAHCQTCHTPRNIMMAEDTGNYLAGADLGGWHAPNITSDPVSGIGAWSEDEIVQYLRTGAAHGKSQSGGPMAEAVSLSLRHLKDEDLHDIADYLKTVPPVATHGVDRPAFAVQEPRPADLTDIDYTIDHAPEAMRDGTSLDGGRLYMSACASCHQPDGQGSEDQFYPSLTSNRAVGGRTADNLVMAISEGIHRETNGYTVAMPAFKDELTPEQIAAVSNYVLGRFGNTDLTVTAEHVDTLGAGGETPFLLRATPWLMWGSFGVLLALGIAAVMVVRRRNA